MEDEDIILEFGGVAYYIDFDGIDNILKTDDPDLVSKEIEENETETTYINGGIEKTKVNTRTYHKGREVDLSKYETYRTLLEILLTYNESDDDSLGVERSLSKTPLPFRIAFNTLVKYGILKSL
jgi:hypothetical protein